MKGAKTGGRTGKGRTMVSFYLDDATRAAVDDLAAASGVMKADIYREILATGVKRWKPPKPVAAPPA